MVGSIPADSPPGCSTSSPPGAWWAAGRRLTLYVSAKSKDEGQTAFRFAQEGKVGVFYWLDGKLGYALSGEIAKSDLMRVADSVYRQLNP